MAAAGEARPVFLGNITTCYITAMCSRCCLKIGKMSKNRIDKNPSPSSYKCKKMRAKIGVCYTACSGITLARKRKLENCRSALWIQRHRVSKKSLKLTKCPFKYH